MSNLNLENDPYVEVDADAVKMVLTCFFVMACSLVAASFMTCGPGVALLVLCVTCYPLYLFAANYTEESMP